MDAIKSNDDEIRFECQTQKKIIKKKTFIINEKNRKLKYLSKRKCKPLN